MFLRERKRRTVPLVTAFARCGLFAFFVLVTFPQLQAGLFSSSAKPVSLEVQPAELVLNGAQDEQGVLVTAAMADGTRMDVTDSVRYTSKARKVVSVSARGSCRPLSGGTAKILVEYQGKSANLAVNTRDTGTIA